MFYLFILSVLWPIYAKENSIKVYVQNSEYSSIQGQCYEGRFTNTVCHQRHLCFEEWAIIEVLGYKRVLSQVLCCGYHKQNNISKIYGWKSDKEKYVKGLGDVVVNYYPMWTMIPFGTPPKSARNWWKSRYHFSDLALEKLTDYIILHSLAFVCLIDIDLC